MMATDAVYDPSGSTAWLQSVGMVVLSLADSPYPLESMTAQM